MKSRIRAAALGVLVLLMIPGCDFSVSRTNSDDPRSGAYVGDALLTLTRGIEEIGNGGNYDFGHVVTGDSREVVFTIENTGIADLLLEGTPAVQVSGSTMFFLDDIPDTVIAAGATTTFSIIFTPTTTGLKSGTVSIPANAAGGMNFTFTIEGTGDALPVPEINLKQGTSNISDGGSFFMGSAYIGGSEDVVITIENTGSAALSLTGTPLVDISGTNESLFGVTVEPDSSVSAGDTTTFTVTFTPDSVGSKNATITVYNDDDDEGTYDFTLIADGEVAPESEINIIQGGSAVPSGGSRDFGTLFIGQHSDLSFTIENNGDADLALTGSPDLVEISGTDSADFSVYSGPSTPVSPSGTTPFTIRFEPSEGGSKSATLSIPNNDADEDPYTITITGTCNAPEIHIRQGSTGISDGGAYSFGEVMIPGSVETVFTIENLGTIDLTLDGSPLVDISGTDAADFTVTAEPVSLLYPDGQAGDFTTFSIEFSPTTPGSKTALVSIANNDSDEDPYTFTLSGTCNEFYGTTTANSTAEVYYGTSIAVDGDNVYISFHDAYALNDDFRLAKSTNNGGSFSTSAINGGSNIGGYSTLYVSGSTLLTSYYYWNGVDDLRFAKSTNGGSSWDIDTIESSDAVGQYASMAVSGSYVYVSYTEYVSSFQKDLIFARSTNGGGNFLDGNTGTNNIITVESGKVKYTATAASGSYVYIAYYDESNGDLKLARSSNYGASFSTTVVDSANDVGQYCAIAASGGNVYIVYYDTAGSLKFARSSDYGGNWFDANGSNDNIQTIGSASTGENGIALYSSTLYVSYTYSGLRFAKSTNGGVDWSTAYVGSGGGCTSIAVADSGSKVYISHGGSSAHLKMSKSLDGGTTW